MLITVPCQPGQRKLLIPKYMRASQKGDIQITSRPPPPPRPLRTLPPGRFRWGSLVHCSLGDIDILGVPEEMTLLLAAWTNPIRLSTLRMWSTLRVGSEHDQWATSGGTQHITPGTPAGNEWFNGWTQIPTPRTLHWWIHYTFQFSLRDFSPLVGSWIV